ncbi:MAG: hypothetical protein LBQ38_00755 [Spirochaetaceae bacterium]|jgi:hypothetical protein|nr:hypothetical protein [Spirochaetaceae bacterium]
MGVSRSRLYTLAVDEYIRNHRTDAVTERLNRYYEGRETVMDEDVKQTVYTLFSREDW